MSAAVRMDDQAGATEAAGGQLAVLSAPLLPAVVFAPGGSRSILDAIIAGVRAEPVDISTEKGRKALKSLVAKVRSTKAKLDEMGAEAKADALEISRRIDAERRTIRDELDALIAEKREPLTAWENAEAARVAGHEEAIAAIQALATFSTAEPALDEIDARIVQIGGLVQRDWMEFGLRADAAANATRESLSATRAAMVKLAADRAEAARIAEEEAETARQEALRLQAEREAKIAEEAAERARLAAEAIAAEEARAEAERAERQRQELERRAEAERAAAAEREQQLADEARKAEAARVAAEARAEQERREAAEREAAAVAAAEQRVRDETARRERAQREEAERARREAEKSAANKEHRRLVNVAAVAALTERVNGLDTSLAQAVIAAIARGEIPRVSVGY